MNIICTSHVFMYGYLTVPVMLELWGMQSTPSLPSLPDLLRPEVIAPDRFLSCVQIEINCVLMLNWIVWNRTVYMNKNGFGRCPRCNGYRRRIWTRRHEFKSWTDCISHSTNTLGEGMNPNILPPAMGK